MNSKAKQRAAATGIGRLQKDPPADALEIVAQPRDRPSIDDAAPGGTYIFDISSDQLGRRLDRFLVDRLGGYPGLSRTRLQTLVEEGHVRLNGAAVRVSSLKLGTAGTIVVDVPAPIAAAPGGEDIRLDIVFEDAHLLVLDKPAGLVVHPAAGHADGTLVNALIAHCGDSLSGIGGVRRPGIVHRLDKDTTGLMVVAKTDAAHRGLADLFADHGRSGSLERSYTAFVWGSPSTPGGTIDRALARHPHQREKIRVVPEGEGRHAVTHWEVVRGWPAASVIACRLETGRTHQIRVHLTEMGHPLIGDPVYGTGFKTKRTLLGPCAGAVVTGMRRQALHASTLGFDHPVTGETLSFHSALPPDLADLDRALAEDAA